MTRSFCVIVFAAMLTGPAGAAGMPTLEELETRMEGSRALQALDAQYEELQSRLQQEKQQRGTSVYSNTSFSDNDEVVDVGRSRSYRQLSTGVGVRVSVLGSRLRWREGVDKLELQLARYESERELTRRELLKKLRSDYATYWAAQRSESLSRSYLEREMDVSRGMLLRTQAGLLLDADRLEFMSGFAMVERDAAVALSNRQRTLATMRMLVTGDIEEGIAHKPAASSTCTASVSTLTAWAETHPDVKFAHQVQASQESTPRDSPLYGVNSEIRFGYNTSTQWPVEQQGGSAVISWSFEVPINFVNQRRLSRTSAAAARLHARLEYELRREEVEQELRTLLMQRPVLQRSLQFATVRLAASDEAVRERELRAVKLAGDVVEQLQQSRLARYHAAKSVVDAELALAQWSAQWALYAPDSCRPRGLYVWSSQAMLAELSQSASNAIVNQAMADGTTHLLLSLDPKQLTDYRHDIEPLRAALRAAHARGLHVELLLGEPTWMLPEHRENLLAIVRDFRALPFDGLHLDIEPNQLDHTGMSTSSWVSALAQTVRAVRTVSPWPIDLSLHPKYLAQKIDGRPLGDHLIEAQVAVTLMIYVSNPERVIEIAQPLLERYPHLMQRVALSSEDSLTREESLFYFDPQERSRRIALIEARLQAPNFRGITLQPAVRSLPNIANSD